MHRSWEPDIGPVWCAWLALKQVCFIKQIPLILVRHPSMGMDAEKMKLLKEMTAQESFPVIWWQNERPRSAWLEQVQLVDRVGRGP